MSTDGPVEEPICHSPALSRVGSMVAQLLNEQHQAPLDPPGHVRLRETYLLALAETRRWIPKDLRDEFDTFTQPSTVLTTSGADLRIAQAQLVGWLEGVFAGARLTTAINDAPRPFQHPTLGPQTADEAGEEK